MLGAFLLRKSLSVELKADGDAGEFRAVFATLNVIDRDGDVIVPGAFREGQAVRIAAWGHGWHQLPVGRGTIHSDDEKAWVDGNFFLDTTHGRETYLTVKALAELQEWSFGFDVLKRSQREFDGQDGVQFLEEIDVFEVSPVLLGAGIDTRTEYVKSAPEALTEGQILDALKGDAEMAARVMKALEPEPPQPQEPKALFSLGSALAQLRLAEMESAALQGA